MFYFFLLRMLINKSLKRLKLWLQTMIVIMLTEYNLGELQIRKQQLKNHLSSYLSLFWMIYFVLH